MTVAAIEDYLVHEHARGYAFDFMTPQGGSEIDFCFFIITKRMK